MSGVAVYRTEIAPEWIDYNGHLRDAYYSLIVSLACDALMDQIGMDEAYRTRTRNTLYTLEMHIHFLREVKKTDVVDVSVRILGTDRKRIHCAFDLRIARYADPVATAELMLLHVHQGDEPKTESFPPQIVEALAKVAAESAAPTGSASTGVAPTAGGSGASAPAAAGCAVEGGGSVPAAAGCAVEGGGSVPAATAPASPIPGSRRMELRSRS